MNLPYFPKGQRGMPGKPGDRGMKVRPVILFENITFILLAVDMNSDVVF